MGDPEAEGHAGYIAALDQRRHVAAVAGVGQVDLDREALVILLQSERASARPPENPAAIVVEIGADIIAGDRHGDRAFGEALPDTTANLGRFPEYRRLNRDCLAAIPFGSQFHRHKPPPLPALVPTPSPHPHRK